MSQLRELSHKRAKRRTGQHSSRASRGTSGNVTPLMLLPTSPALERTRPWLPSSGTATRSFGWANVFLPCTRPEYHWLRGGVERTQTLGRGAWFWLPQEGDKMYPGTEHFPGRQVATVSGHLWGRDDSAPGVLLPVLSLSGHSTTSPFLAANALFSTLQS